MSELVNSYRGMNTSAVSSSKEIEGTSTEEKQMVKNTLPAGDYADGQEESNIIVNAKTFTIMEESADDFDQDQD